MKFTSHSQEADCFFQDCRPDACHRAAVADAGRGQHVRVCSDVRQCFGRKRDHHPPPSPADWTQFLRDNMQRCNPYETVLSVNNVGGLQLKWITRITDCCYSNSPLTSPAVANGVVYIGSPTDPPSPMPLQRRVCAERQHRRQALELYRGNLCGIPQPAVANGVVYIGSGRQLVRAECQHRSQAVELYRRHVMCNPRSPLLMGWSMSAPRRNCTR